VVDVDEEALAGRFAGPVIRVGQREAAGCRSEGAAYTVEQARLVRGEQEHDVPRGAVQGADQVGGREGRVDDGSVDHGKRQVDAGGRVRRDEDGHGVVDGTHEMSTEPDEGVCHGIRLGEALRAEARAGLVHQGVEPGRVGPVDLRSRPGHREQQRDAGVGPRGLQLEHRRCGERPGDRQPGGRAAPGACAVLGGGRAFGRHTRPSIG